MAQDSIVLKSTFWYTFSSFLLKGIGFVTTPIFTRILTKAEFGIYSNVITWYGIVSIIATLSLNASLARARFDFKNDMVGYVGTNLLLGSFSSVLVSLIILFNIRFFINIFVFDEKYIYIILANVLVSPAYDMFLNLQRFEYRYKLVVLLTGLIALSSVAISFILIRLMDDNLLARVLGTYIPSFLVAIVLYFKYLSAMIAKKKFDLSYCKYSLVISIPFVFHLLSGTILNSSDKSMITKMAGPEENALYSIAYTVAMIVSVIWQAMDKAFSPWLGEKLNEGAYKKIYKYSKVYVLLFCIIVYGLILVAPEILIILGGQSYLQAKEVIPPVMIGNLMILIYSLYVNVEQYEKRTTGMAIATASAALINVITNWIFIPVYGYIAASYTTLLCDVLMVVFHFILVKKMNLSFVYDTRFMALILVSGVAFSPILTLLYSCGILRYGLIVIYLIIIAMIFIKYRKVIKALLPRRN